MGTTGVIDFWFDFASTYSYPAVMTIEDRAAKSGVKIRWRPILLGPIFAAQGWDDSPFNIYPAKGRYMWRDMERLCKAAGLPFQRPPVFPQRSVDAAKVALYGLDHGWGPSFIRSIFIEHFAMGRDIADYETLGRAVLNAGSTTPVEMALSAPSRLREETEAAHALGIFGAPTFTVGKELFWGFDRMDQAIAWAANHASATPRT